jgi:hypothetical protein
MMTGSRTVLATLATALALAGCAAQPAAERASTPSIDTARATYGQIIDQVYGTADQRSAAAESGWLKTQLAIASCMSAAGQRYVPARYQPVPDTGPAPGDLLAFAPARPDFGVGRTVQALAAAGETVQPALVGADAAAEARYAQALAACSPGDLMDLSFPDGQERLSGQLVAALTAVQRSATPTLAADYPVCLATHGVTATDLSDLYIQVAHAYPAVSYEKKSDVTKLSSWAPAVAFEREAAAADAACRADAVPVAVLAAEPVLKKFAADHAAVLNAVSASWAQMAADVVSLRAKIA